MLQVPIFPSNKFTFNIKIVENENLNEETKYFFHIQCVKREWNNFYTETNVGEKVGQIEYLDNFCEGNLFKIGVIIAQNVSHLNGSTIIKGEVYRETKCPNPKESNIYEPDINYNLVIHNNGSSAELKWKCYRGKKYSDSKRRRIGDDGAGPSEQRELPNENKVPKITQDLLANFAGKQSDQNQQENEEDRPIIATLNLLDNFGSEDQQKAPSE
ncbi:hypothetical protein niasHT_029424 [Heterodera trifolii]|uniref:Uncharacterized protein n=1 Tax=Heterodera trifolii TaxID=157864 RepID=A0ABD2KQ88_9BILA